MNIVTEAYQEDLAAWQENGFPFVNHSRANPNIVSFLADMQAVVAKRSDHRRGVGGAAEGCLTQP